jgi:acyl-coenzyme A synthetase/AMP-(fatty) acid ligase
MNYYGLTETAGLCAGVIPQMDGARPGSIGVPLGCRIRIVDQAGEPVKAGETGELLICSDQLMAGYWREPLLTERVLRDGWFHTGDLVRREPDGSLSLMGRLTESFKDRRGEFIHPAAIEEAMELHPLVVEAGVCGYTAADGETAMAAFVVTEPAAAWGELEGELRRFVAERLGTHRTPDRIERIDVLPRGTNDKLLRRILQERCSPHE